MSFSTVIRTRGAARGERWLAALLCVAAACNDEDLTGVPQPDPLPLVSAVRATQGGDDPAPVRVVGLPGAVAGAGKVTATLAGAVAESQATAAGTFTLEIAARGEDVVELRYERSAAATLTIAHRCPGGATCNAPPAPHPRPGIPPVSAPVDGKVVVSGQATAAGVAVVIANADSGDARRALAGTDGDFDVEISASAGDRLLVFHEQGASLEPPWELTVP